MEKKFQKVQQNCKKKTT